MEPKTQLRGILKDVGNDQIAATNPGNHPPFIDIIIEAIEELKERKGSSKQSIVKYILSRYNLVGAGWFTEKQFSGNLNRALRRGVTNSTLLQISGTGANGRFKLANKKMTSRGKPRPASQCTRSVSLRPRRKVHWDLPSYRENNSSDEERVTRRSRMQKCEKAWMEDEEESGSEMEEEEEKRGRRTRRKKRFTKRPSDEESNSQTKDSDEGLSEYELQRRRNIMENKALLQDLLQGETLKSLRPPLKKKIKKPEVLGPTRRSLRLQRVTPDGDPLPPSPPSSSSCLYDPYTTTDTVQVRTPPGPLVMKCEEMSEEEEKWFRASFIESIKDGDVAMETTLTSDVQQLSQLTLTEDTITKLTQKRITSLAFHPSSARPLVAAGDTYGNIGMWDVLGGVSSVVRYRPHVGCVSGLLFPPSPSATKLFSCSYDYSVRCADLVKGVFEDVFSPPLVGDLSFRCMDFSQSDWLLVGRMNGTAHIIDTRLSPNHRPAYTWTLHEKRLTCVHVNPVDNNYFVSAAADSTVRLWDMRHMSGTIQRLRAGRMVSSVYFSPLTGCRLLMTSLDNCISVFQSSVVGSTLTQLSAIAHNNQTGRWLSNFKATWHSRNESCFIVGSMKYPRQVEVHSVSGGARGGPLLSLRSDLLQSVCSLVLTHPTAPLLVGGNSSGRVFLWK